MTTQDTPTAGVNETFDAQGRLEIPDDALFTDEEAKDFSEPTPDPETPATPEPKPEEEVEEDIPTHEEPTNEPGVIRAKPGDPDYDPRLPESQQPVKSAKEPEKPAETPDPQPAQPEPTKLYAGKYQTKEELNAAFIQLGGDPANYGNDPEKVAEAYQVRQSEFTRTRQAVAQEERQKELAQKQAERQQQAKGLVQEEIQKVIAKQPKDVTELLQHLTEAMTNIVTQTQQPLQPEIDPNQIAETIQPIIKEREEKITELHDLEKDVPRLTSDINFRNAFAVFLQGQKSSGRYINMKESMKSFLGPNQTIVNDQVKKAQDEAAAKNDAIHSTQPNGGVNNSAPEKKTPEDDIVSGILSEHSTHVKKYRGY